jgi:hypothetical protein
MKRKKPVIILEIPKKRENNIMVRSGKPKTVNNEPLILTQPFAYVLQPLET